MNRRDIFKFFGLSAGIPAVQSIEMLQMKPKDTLVVKVDGRITHENAEALKQALQDKFPEQQILVIDNQIDLSVLRHS